MTTACLPETKTRQTLPPTKNDDEGDDDDDVDDDSDDNHVDASLTRFGLN